MEFLRQENHCSVLARPAFNNYLHESKHWKLQKKLSSKVLMSYVIYVQFCDSLMNDCILNFVTIFLLYFQIYACIIVFFLSNMIEAQLLSTGAFEVTLNGLYTSFSLSPCYEYNLKFRNDYLCEEIFCSITIIGIYIRTFKVASHTWFLISCYLNLTFLLIILNMNLASHFVLLYSHLMIKHLACFEM